MPDEPSHPNHSRSEAIEELKAIFWDTAVVVGMLVAIWLAEFVMHSLVPPHGPILWKDTWAEIRFQWMVDGAHAMTFAAFIWSLGRRLWRR